MKHPRAFERLFQHVTAITWVSIFLGFAVTGWIVWLGLISWSVVEAYQLSTIVHANGTTFGSESLLRRSIKLTLVISFIFTYGLFWWNDRGSEERGSHPRTIMRTLPIWKKLQEYFPINLILCEDIMEVDPSVENARSAQTAKHQPGKETVVACNPSLFPTNRNYLVGYHPHGIFGVGAFVNFATEANRFSTLFPGLKPWITTLPINFKAPFHRDFLMSFNLISATYKGISYLLDPGKCGSTGNFVVIVMGGAPEALDSRPGRYIFHTNKRYGFFKLALMTGKSMITAELCIHSHFAYGREPILFQRNIPNSLPWHDSNNSNQKTLNDRDELKSTQYGSPQGDFRCNKRPSKGTWKESDDSCLQPSKKQCTLDRLSNEASHNELDYTLNVAHNMSLSANALQVLNEPTLPTSRDEQSLPPNIGVNNTNVHL
ncbi:hypothetical protein CRM22_003171 [Opisthorchis felineus]|uniref:Acyltransferase n=1 Tax=Opisthorchis felineus TaxID=147828 RepID=A0A4S2M8Q5_OPIFE|nr:hypothetical protein CRM22_003171 [Opisthorchis felineus]